MSCLIQPLYAQTVLHLDAANSSNFELGRAELITKIKDNSQEEQFYTLSEARLFYHKYGRLSSGLQGIDFGEKANKIDLSAPTLSSEWLDQSEQNALGFSLLISFKVNEIPELQYDLLGNITSSNPDGLGLQIDDEGNLIATVGNATISRHLGENWVGKTYIVGINYNVFSEELILWDSETNSSQKEQLAKGNFSNGETVALGYTDEPSNAFNGVVGEVKVYPYGLDEKVFDNEIELLKAKWLNKPLLPVEVMGEEGKVVSRHLYLDKSQANATSRLWLQINNLSYENKVSVKINGGNWYKLNHTSVDMQYQEKARGGMAHGGFNTIRLSIPATDIKDGNNTISFRFNMSDGISSGFRVIRMNILDELGAKLLPESYFSEDNPELWVGPYTDDTSIEEGKYLWYNAPLITNYLHPDSTGFWYDYALQPAQPMKATCADCHTQDGRDLELFAYSNESIIERAKFHKLSEEEGKKIASYIRSLSAKHDNVNRHGRPWNPPYQPGAELKGKSIEYWAAGAGLDAVLDKDADMLTYMFPNGITPETVSAFFDQDTPDIDRTTLPLAVQFPDWKHWLPMVHPKDAFTKGTYYQESYENFTDYIYGMKDDRIRLNPEKAYEVFRDYLEGLPREADGTINLSNFSKNKVEELKVKHENFRYNFRFYIGQGGTDTNHWRVTEGKGYESLSDNVALEFALTGMARLMAVKNFEIMQEFNLQDQAPDHLAAEDFPTRRQWIHGQSKHVFEIPAHFTGCQDGDCQTFQGQERSTGQYETTAWYHLQAILAGGEGDQWWNGPVDYNYQPQFILSSSYSSGIYDVLRYYHSIGTMYKTKTWSGDVTTNDGNGFRIRVQGPWYFLGKEGDGGANNFLGFAPVYWPKLLDEVHPGLTKMVLDALMREFLKAVRKHKISDWTRWEKGMNRANFLDPVDKRTVQDVTGSVDNPDTAPLWADHMYWVIQESINLGVDCQIIDEMIDWSHEAWPLIDFEQFRGNAQPELDLKLNGDLSCISAVEAMPVSEGTITKYDWYVNDLKVSNNNPVFSADNFSAGDWVYCRIKGQNSCTGEDYTIMDSVLITPDLGVSVSLKYKSSNLTNGGQKDMPLGESVSVALSTATHPNDIFDAKVWLDAMTIEQSALGYLTEWKDISGNKNHATADNEFRPYYNPKGINGLPSVQFGSDKATGLEIFNRNQQDFLNEDWTIIMAAQADSREYVSSIFGNLSSNKETGFGFKTTSVDMYSFDIENDGLNSLNGNRLPSTGEFVARVTKRGNKVTVYVNGVYDNEMLVEDGVDLANNLPFMIGLAGDVSSNSTRFMKGHIGEFIFFEQALSLEETQFLEGYLAHKWQMDNVLSLTHNYRFKSPVSLKLETPNAESFILSTTDKHTIQLSNSQSYGMYNFSTLACGDAVYDFTFNKEEANEAPVWFEEKMEFQIYEGISEFNYQIVEDIDIIDKDGDPITFAFIAGPDWLNCSPTGELTADIPEDAEDENIFIIGAFDSNGNLTTIPITIELNVEPVLSLDDSFEKVSVYPIPTQSVLFVKGQQKGVAYSVLDISGKVLLNGILDNSLKINTGGLSSGLYFLRLGNNRVKFIKD